MVVAVLLAAGRGQRMGAIKPLVEVEGKTMLAHALSFLQALELPVVVVTGYEGDRVEAALPDHVSRVRNPDWEQGMASSIRVGVAALPRQAEAALVHLVDLPYLKPETGRQLLEAYQGTITAPIHRGKRGHPVIFPRRLFPDLKKLSGDRGAWRLLEGNPVRLVEVDTEAIHRDVDQL